MGRKSSGKKGSKQVAAKLNSVTKKPSNSDVANYHQQLQSIAAGITNVDFTSTPTKDRRISYV